METILITGAGGMVAKQLIPLLTEKGYQVKTLSTRKDTGSFYWNIQTGEIDSKALDDVDHIIHLAGAGIGDKRWTAKRKAEILDSRIKSTNLLYSKIQEENIQLKTFISASAIGYYGTVTTDKIFSEEDSPGKDFIGDVCVKWEQSAEQFEKSEARIVKLRIGVVLAGTGGVLFKLKGLIKSGVGAALGSGKQYMPWIHIDDLCGMIIHSIQNEKLKGSYNAVTSQHITNKEFTKAFAASLNKKIWLPNVPGFVLKLRFGKMADILLKGSRVSSEKIEATGFEFRYQSLEEALEDIKA